MKHLIAVLVAVAGLGVGAFFFKGLFFCLEQAILSGDVPAQVRLGAEFCLAVALVVLIAGEQLGQPRHRRH